MSHRDHYKMAACLDQGALIEDPGDGGTIVVDPNAGYQVCKFTTGGSETRVMPATPTAMAVGSRLVFDFITDGGNLLIQFDDTTNTLDGTNYAITFADAGDYAEFVVRQVDAAGTKAWTLLLNLGGSLSAP